MDIAQIDKNFEVKTNIEKDDIRFYDVNSGPFRLHGIFYENGRYRRMPEEVAKTVSPGVKICMRALPADGSGSGPIAPMWRSMRKCR